MPQQQSSLKPQEDITILTERDPAQLQDKTRNHCSTDLPSDQQTNSQQAVLSAQLFLCTDIRLSMSPHHLSSFKGPSLEEFEAALQACCLMPSFISGLFAFLDLRAVPRLLLW